MWRSHRKTFGIALAAFTLLTAAAGDRAFAALDQSLYIAPGLCRLPPGDTNAAVLGTRFGGNYLSRRDATMALGPYSRVIDCEAGDRMILAALESATPSTLGQSLATDMPDARRAEEYLVLGQYTKAFELLFAAL